MWREILLNLADEVIKEVMTRCKKCQGTGKPAKNGESQMHGITTRLHIHTTSKRNAWKIPLSAATIAIIATLSVGANNFQANADDATTKNPVALAEEKITDTRAKVMIKITDALLSGELTPADAAETMISFEEGVVEKMEYLRGIQQRIEHAVESGEMTRHEADARYVDMLKAKKEHSGNERANAYLKKVAGEIKEAVANGTMTSEEGKAKYAEAEARIEQRMAQKNSGNKRLEAYLEKVGAEIKEAVANGEMTLEEGKAKYAETVEAVKQRMAGAKSKITKEEYDAAAAKMTEMVKAGEITREQMESRLNRMKKAMASKDKKTSDDCIELRKKLGVAVRNGEMTREEAGKIWEEEGC